MIGLYGRVIENQSKELDVCHEEIDQCNRLLLKSQR